MKRLTLVTICILIALSGQAQTVLLDVDRGLDSIPSEKGPNLKRFTHVAWRLGFIGPQDESGARIHYGTSVNLAATIRKKYKIGNVYSMGWDLSLQYSAFKLNQKGGKILPDTLRHDRQRIDMTSIGAGYYNRFNFDPGRGNYLGYYLDIGIAGEWNFSKRNVMRNKLEDGSVSVNKVKRLPYVNDFSARAYARIGLNKFSIFGSYRLTELITKDHMPELPASVIGIEMAFY